MKYTKKIKPIYKVLKTLNTYKYGMRNTIKITIVSLTSFMYFLNSAFNNFILNKVDNNNILNAKTKGEIIQKAIRLAQFLNSNNWKSHIAYEIDKILITSNDIEKAFFRFF